MKSLLASVVVGACATGSALLPPTRLAGCWASSEGALSKMQWTVPDVANPNSLRGVKEHHFTGSTVRSYYAIDPDGQGFVFCELDNEQGATGRCFQIAQGRQGSLEGGRAFVDIAGARLRLSIVGDGPERVIFNGQREPCR